MHRLRIVHHLRSIAFLLVLGCIIAGTIGLWWVNHTGLPESWRHAIEREISERQGIHVRMGSISYNPLRGIIAGKVRIFDDPEKTHEISRVESLILDFDNTKLARGIVRLDKAVLSDATLSLPLDANDPASELLTITRANGTLLLPGERQIVISNAHGDFYGIQVTLNARLSGSKKSAQSTTPAQSRENNNRIVSQVVSELRKWSFDPDHPPQLQIFAEGTAGDTSSISARLSFVAHAIEKNQHRLDELTARAEISGNLLNITSLQARDGKRVLNAHLDYDLNRQSGRFDVRSSLELPPLLQSWFELPPTRDILVAGRQELDASGDFTFEQDQPIKLHMTGRARCDSALVRGIRFDTIESAFSWLDGGLFLKDLHLTRPDGEATGKALIQWPLVRITLNSSLLPNIYQPLFAGKPLERVIDHLGTTDESKLDISLEGGFDATDRTSWAYTGHGQGENLSYRGVPVNNATCQFSLSSRQLQFNNGEITFNYANYPLRKRFDGPLVGNASFDSILYTRSDKLVTVNNIRGDLWAAPLTRMFSSKIADLLENYRFHTPPGLTASGVIDTGGNNRTNLTIDFNSASAADYTLLGANATLTRPKGLVTINGRDVSITNFDFGIFNGNASAELHFTQGKPMSAEVQWTKLSMDEIAKCYNLKMDCGGDLTGRTEFTINPGDVTTLNGKGLCALEHTQLFSVPMLGPLSNVISGVLRDKRAGFERAKSAFCSFNINDGILTTDDFSTATTSLVFAGDGSVDLTNRTLDMTMRLNARGLLGFITLPIRPFYGMFQFRGTGPLKQTKWENVMFTNPSDKQRKLLLDAPKAKLIPAGG